MRKGSFLALCLALVTLTISTAGPVAAELAGAPPPPFSHHLPGPDGKIAAAVDRHLAALHEGEMVTVIVTLTDRADLSRIPGASRAARQRGVIQALQAKAKASQDRVQALLAARQAQGKVSQVIPFWVFNGLAVTATEDVIRELAARTDVARISPDEIPIIPTQGESALEPNLTVINAPALWDLGFTGQEVVVASMDSGVDASHPDLSDRWRGGTNSWFDPYGEHPLTPTDLSGHGTRITGVIVGGDAGGTSIGVAPGAQWIAVKIFDDQGGSTATAIHQGFQWLLDPDGYPATPDGPHVVNNSWTFGYPGCNLSFEPDLQALRAAGILPVFAAGNGGPNAGTSYSPANNPSALAVGATDDADSVYAFSSRGPSSCGEAETIFPELVAPGVGIHTTDLYGFYTNATGTSLAAPHVAGGLALLLSAWPDLTDVEQQEALIGTALDLGAPGPDNDFGYGRLDLLAAYEWLLEAPHPTPTADEADLSALKADAMDPVPLGGTIVYTVTVENKGPDGATPITTTDTLPPQVSYSAAAGVGWTCDHAAGEVTCTLPSLDIGVAPSILITVTAPSAVGLITNTTTVTSIVTDPDLSNNHSIEQTSVEAFPTANLSIVKRDSPDPVGIGAPLTYTLDVTNSGPDAATGITVRDTLPSAVRYDAAAGVGWTCGRTGREVTCTRPSLDVGAAPSILITVTAPSGTGVIRNTATVTSTTIDPNPADNSDAAQTSVDLPPSEADLSITKLDNPDPVSTGATLTYTLSITNAGPALATTVMVTDTLPVAVTYHGTSGTGWSCMHVEGKVTCTLPSLGAGVTSKVFVRVTALAGAGTLTNTATVAGQQADPDQSSNQATTTTEVEPSHQVVYLPVIQK